jgi:hypothetical protein
MEELIKRICGAIEVDENIAITAIGHVLGFVQKEFPEGPVADLLAKLPGAQQAIDAAASSAPGEGFGAAFGGLASLIGGAKGDIMALAANLSGIGLDMGQMQKLGREIFAHADETIGKENVNLIIQAVPTLAPFR